MSEPRRVRLVHDPTRVGVLTGREQLRRERRFLQAQFAEGVRWVPDDQLEDATELRLSPLDMLEAGKLGRPVDLRRTLTHVKLSGRLADVIYSMEATNTDFHAYQFKPVVKLLQSPVNGILIADEVGLGKTIEAGLIWTELRSRFDMRRLLVLCPAALREKWQRELATKFGVAARACDAREALEALQDAEASAKGFAIVASAQGLRPPTGWEEGEQSGRAATKLASYLRSMENEERLVDLLVVDEAHHLRNPATRTNELGQLFKSVSEYSVLLTATPIHNRNEDLFSLLNLLDPDTFTHPDVFAKILDANAPLVKARDLVLGPSIDGEQLRELLRTARSNPLLQDNRQLAMIVDTDLSPERLARHDVRGQLAYRLETVNLLAHAVTRTRKRDVKEWRVIREPKAQFVTLQPVEERFYGLVSDVVIEYAMQCAVSERFLLAQPQRQMTSSMAAALRSWQQRRAELEELEEAEAEGNAAERRSSLGPLVREIVRRSENYVDLDELINVDAKYKGLLTVLRSYQKDFPGQKVVLFSAFRATLAYLDERLSADGFSCIQLKGGQRDSKDDIINRFASPDGPNILLSSEVGGEGVDLQFSRMVINYDLPWNPMRLEQRIGRIDRLGQKAEKVLIWNILYSNTIDARIYERLYDKLDLCRNALGDFEAILGEEIRRLEIDLLSGKLTVEEQEQRIEQTRMALENLRLEEHQLEQNAANLIAYGDYILKHVQAARDLHRWIGGDDIRNYVLDHLRMHYVGCHIQLIGTDAPVYDIALSDEAKYDLAEFVRGSRVATPTKLTAAASRPVRVRFENRVAGQFRPTEEIVSQFHPLVRMVSAQILDRGEHLTPAVALALRRTSESVQLPTGTYVLAAALWSFQGLQDSERLAYAATTLDDSDQLLDPEVAERLASEAVSRGEEWPEASSAIDIGQAFGIARDVLLTHLYDGFESMRDEIAARNEDRADVQLRTLDEHLRQQTAKLEDIRRKHMVLKRDSLVRATEGRIQALQSRVNQQRIRIESRRQIKSEPQEIAIALIHIS